MQISQEIDSIINSLNSIKPLIVEDKNRALLEFKNILNTALSKGGPETTNTTEKSDRNHEVETDTPTWVDNDYAFNIGNPRKPNMRELMETLTGKTVEELYADPKSNWKNVAAQATEILYGVVGKKIDDRDWKKIMASPNIVAEARAETTRMHQPYIDIESETDENNVITNQFAVIKDRAGQHLRTLEGGVAEIQQTIKNFGAAKIKNLDGLKEKITFPSFNTDTIVAMETLSDPILTKKIGDIALKTATEALATKIENEIPLEEFEKL